MQSKPALITQPGGITETRGQRNTNSENQPTLHDSLMKPVQRRPQIKQSPKQVEL